MPPLEEDEGRSTPLLTRWSLLMRLGHAAHLSYLLAFFAMTQAVLNMPDGWQPYVAAIFLLQIGLLAFLDYRDWVRHKVQQEASRLDANLSVSSRLLLSSPELQNQYHRWMDKTPAVARFPYLAPLVFACFTLKFASRFTEGDCGGAFALMVPLPSMLLSLLRVAMESNGAPKWLQSAASLAAPAYKTVSLTAFMTSSDPCAISLAPNWTISPAGSALFVAIITAEQMATIPCTIQHLAALCLILGPCDFFPCYIWSQRRHGGLGLSSYPSHHVELVIIIAAAKAATLLAGAGVRYRLAHENMTSFLRSVRPHRH